MTERPPLTRSIIEAARENAYLVQKARVIVWHPQAAYFDTDDTPNTRARFKGRIVAEVSKGGHVEKIKQRKARRAK